jgi:uncharacterized small protein (DUF1192 family)
MLTYLGKFLVLLNAFAAVAVVAWAVSAYTTRVDAADAVDTAGEKLVDKVKRLDKKAADAQVGYAPALAQVADADARLAALREQIAKRLKQADGGTFYNIYITAGPNVKDPANPNALDRVDRVVWTDDPKQQIKGLDGKPLQGVQQVRKLLDDEQKAAGASIDAIDRSTKELTALNDKITELDARYAWLEEVGKRHEAELPVLADLRVNWENRSGSLQRRRTQLLLRLEDLKGSKVGVTPVPTVPPPALPSEFNVAPKK